MGQLEPEVVSVAQARIMAGVGTTTLYKLIGEGKLKTAKLGTRRLVRVDSIRELLAACSAAA